MTTRGRFMRRIGLILGATLGALGLFFGILCLNESVADPPPPRGWVAAFVPSPPSRSSYLPGLALTIAGAGLLGFAIGRAGRPGPPGPTMFLD